jgi:superfamily II DNA or RNA helicase
MTRLIDNRGMESAADVVRAMLSGADVLSVLTPEVSLHAFNALLEDLNKVEAARLLLPDKSIVDEEQCAAFRLPGLEGGSSDRRERNRLQLTRLAQDLKAWLEGRAQIRATAQRSALALYHVQGEGRSKALHGSSTFSRPGLGLAPPDGPVMNTLMEDRDSAEQLLAWFDSIWFDESSSRDVLDAVLADLEWVASDKSPELLYSIILHRLFQDSTEELTEERVMKTRTGIKDTRVWNKLYRFQRDGVLGAIDKIERHNGCIIADSVGLGKTFEGLAIIKYYELRNDRVLVICPKRLRENWSIYTINDRRNPFADDRFNFDVLNHTDLTRTSGKSGEINLETLNWGNYDLVVIDESHNFRNNPPRRDGLTRYGRLMRDVIRAGVKTKVLMLSATPVNSRMNDLKNQIAFITEGEDDALWDSGIPSLENTLRKAQTRFNQWLKADEEERTTDALLNALDFNYFRVLDLLTIARSRRHIERYYDTREIGRFPERMIPRNPRPDIDLQGQFPALTEINRDIRRLNLAAYAPLKYVLPGKLEEYGRKYDLQLGGESVFKQIDREESLIHLMRVNLFKRMESSIHSFSTTIAKLLASVRELIERLDEHEQAEVEELDIEDVDIEAEEFQPLLTGNKIKVLIQDVDRIRWKQELEEDEELLVKLLREARAIDAGRDAKLEHLKEILRQKCSAPINPGNRKAIVFTAFADTAEYLYDNLAPWADGSLAVDCALVTGRTGGNRTTVPGLRRDQATLLTHFSPISKEWVEDGEEDGRPIDFLIATDCVSEGQNLQDCDIVINYDIHWNPVRIIQRFGRIDRLGSRNERIQLVNFWPNMELEEYIDLEARVSGRMVLLDISATGEENLIEADFGRMRDLEYRRRQLEQLQREIVDLEDLSNGISITDMTLNDFRLDRGALMKQHAELVARAPLGIHSALQADEVDDPHLRPGVIFCLEHTRGTAPEDAAYQLGPHYLVYVSDDGEVLLDYTQSKRTLDLLKRLALGRSTSDVGAFSRLRRTTRDYSAMSRLQELLAVAVDSIVGRQAERGVESLFRSGGTLLGATSARGLDDFEVVGFVVVLPGSEAT